jgi:sarcosine oxidase subunit alpha
VTFTFDGGTIEAFTGETIAAALLARGVRTLRTTRMDGAPRGLLCGIGACFDCLVTLEGPDRPRAVRACITPVADGLTVRAHDLDRDRAPGDGIGP